MYIDRYASCSVGFGSGEQCVGLSQLESAFKSIHDNA